MSHPAHDALNRLTDAVEKDRYCVTCSQPGARIKLSRGITSYTERGFLRVTVELMCPGCRTSERMSWIEELEPV